MHVKQTVAFLHVKHVYEKHDVHYPLAFVNFPVPQTHLPSVVN